MEELQRSDHYSGVPKHRSSSPARRDFSAEAPSSSLLVMTPKGSRETNRVSRFMKRIEEVFGFSAPGVRVGWATTPVVGLSAARWMTVTHAIGAVEKREVKGTSVLLRKPGRKGLRGQKNILVWK